ncbi:citrate synthase family protein [Maritalea porphyrae]|uniref:citrate synthase family protein n=1 Tax=Maritalea porphyrae TaxID=880732 RepID=UPI0022AED0B0|nr:citrate synthase family protein [Maritalea porphyrae]MCZ4272059.1 citrate synthase family protein [Maritalea porphyrae]
MKNYKDILQYSMDAGAVCAQLGISADTLYAYVSRGLIRKIAHPQDGRRNLYHSGDFDRLISRKKSGRSRAAVAASTISWGEPVLKSSITEIRDQKLFYRGQNAVALSQSHGFIGVFEILMGEKFRGAEPNINLSALLGPKSCSPIHRLMMMLTLEASTIGSSGGTQTARRLLRQAGLVIAGCADDQPKLSLETLLANSLSAHPTAPDIIRRALILCADHELNASAYAARVAASAKANLPAALLAGVATLSGDAHGGMTNLAKAWKSEAHMALTSGRALPTPGNGKPPPGFGHPFYPNGDPRALELVKACDFPQNWVQIIDVVHKQTGFSPTLDFGLALVEEHLDLPEGSGLGIFALGRMAGWMAHIFEQRKKGKLIRPRAIFSGQRNEG